MVYFRLSGIEEFLEVNCYCSRTFKAKPDVGVNEPQPTDFIGRRSTSYHITNVSFLAPTHPREVEVKALKGDELLVTWKAPSKPNGNVTHYYVYWQPQPLSREKLDQRNYCKDSE